MLYYPLYSYMREPFWHHLRQVADVHDPWKEEQLNGQLECKLKRKKVAKIKNASRQATTRIMNQGSTSFVLAGA
jgi:hypothetical protein